MADWFNIVDAQVDPDAPLTSELAYAWRDNHIAAMQGAPGAPGLWVSGLQKTSVGDVVKYQQTNTVQIQGATTPTTLASSVRFLGWGSVRAKVGVYRNGGAGGTVTFSRRRDGVTTELASYNYTNIYTDYSVDLDYRPHDELLLFVVGHQSSGFYTYVSNHKISTSGDDLWFAALSPISGATFQTFWNTP